MKKIIKMILVLILVFSSIAKPNKISGEEEDETISARFYVSTTGRNSKIDVRFNKNWFADDARNYSHDLAKASLGLATSAFRPFAGLDNDVMADRNLSEYLSDAHFLDLRSDDYDKDPSMYTVSTVMGHQKVGTGDQAFELIAVGVCGQGYVDEWESNFSIGDGKIHDGFDRSSKLVYDRIFGYIASRHLSGPMKIWISGFSRAAAISNVTAARLSDSDAFGPENVFAYTFATPRTIIDETADRYRNIFNIIGKADPVPDVPFKEWGYSRYGIDLYTPILETDTDFEEKRVKANVIYKQITGIDYWYNHEANEMINDILSYLIEIAPNIDIYVDGLQDKLIRIWESKNRIYVLKDLLELASDPILINDSNREAANELMNYLTMMITDYYDKDSVFRSWNTSASAGANLLQSHTPELYVSWIFSVDKGEDLFTDNLDYTIVHIDSKYPLKLYRNNELIETIDLTQKKTPEGNVYLTFEQEEAIAMLPGDQNYSIRLDSKEETDFYSSIAFPRKAGMPAGRSADFVFYNLNENDSFIQTYTADHKILFSSDSGLDESRLQKDSYAVDTALSIMVSRKKFLRFSWRQMALMAIGIGLLAIAVFCFQFVYLIGRFRFARKMKKGYLSKDSKFNAWPLLSDTAIFLLFLFREFYGVLFPENEVLSLAFKAAIGIITILIAYISYRRRKNDLSLFILIATGVFLAADLLTTSHLAIGGMLHIVAYGLLCYAFIKEEKPDKKQIGLWIFMSLASVFVLSFIKGEYGTLRLMAILYLTAAFAMVITSFPMPRRVFTGSILLFVSGILLIYNQIHGTTFFSHIVSLGTYYAALLILSSSLIRQKGYRLIPVLEEDGFEFD